MDLRVVMDSVDKVIGEDERWNALHLAFQSVCASCQYSGEKIPLEFYRWYAGNLVEMYNATLESLKRLPEYKVLASESVNLQDRLATIKAIFDSLPDDLKVQEIDHLSSTT